MGRSISEMKLFQSESGTETRAVLGNRTYVLGSRSNKHMTAGKKTSTSIITDRVIAINTLLGSCHVFIHCHICTLAQTTEAAGMSLCPVRTDNVLFASFSPGAQFLGECTSASRSPVVVNWFESLVLGAFW